MFSEFNAIVDKAKASIETAATEVQEEISALEARIHAATAEADQLQAEYDAALLADSDKAMEIKDRLSVQRDMAAALERQLRPILAQREQVRKEAISRAAEAIAEAVGNEGNASIRKCRTEAEEKREAYVAALQNLERVQHGVADVGRRLHPLCGKEGLSVPPMTVERYSRDALLVDEKFLAESESTASIMWG